jgi:hypothetical protein
VHIPTVALVFFTAACVVTGSGENVRHDLITVTMKRGLKEGRPVIEVDLQNSSPQILCVRSQVVNDPYSYDIKLRLRDTHQQDVPRYPTGILLPPIEGVIRLEPGQHTLGQYYLDSRFKLKDRGPSVRGEMTARASFRYGICDDALSLIADTGWQPI